MNWNIFESSFLLLTGDHWYLRRSSFDFVKDLVYQSDADHHAGCWKDDRRDPTLAVFKFQLEHKLFCSKSKVNILEYSCVKFYRKVT